MSDTKNFAEGHKRASIRPPVWHASSRSFKYAMTFVRLNNVFSWKISEKSKELYIWPQYFLMFQDDKCSYIFNMLIWFYDMEKNNKFVIVGFSTVVVAIVRVQIKIISPPHKTYPRIPRLSDICYFLVLVKFYFSCLITRSQILQYFLKLSFRKKSFGFLTAKCSIKKIAEYKIFKW
jgi:hypothetical protein